ncbi:hypothetical protein FRC10_005770 [Ceratobasidium sp. 414]|nr:hypothetical protein FRC10_005770 [Ceratobasidium sp. 414]
MPPTELDDLSPKPRRPKEKPQEYSINSGILSLDPRPMDSRERCSLWVSSTSAANQLCGPPAHPSLGPGHDADASAKWMLDLERSRGKLWPAPLLRLPGAAAPRASTNVSGLDRSCFIGPSHFEKYFDASTWMFGPEEPTIVPRVPHRPSIVAHERHTSSLESHPTLLDTVYRDSGAEEHINFNSLHKSPEVSRLDLLQAWRVRTGLVPPASFTLESSTGQAISCTRSCGARGGLLPLSVLGRIVRDLLGMAASGTHPRRVLAPLAMASKRLRGVTAPFIYEHVTLRGKGDREIYARVGASKYVRYVIKHARGEIN